MSLASLLPETIVLFGLFHNGQQAIAIDCIAIAYAKEITSIMLIHSNWLLCWLCDNSISFPNAQLVVSVLLKKHPGGIKVAITPSSVKQKASRNQPPPFLFWQSATHHNPTISGWKSVACNWPKNNRQSARPSVSLFYPRQSAGMSWRFGSPPHSPIIVLIILSSSYSPIISRKHGSIHCIKSKLCGWFRMDFLVMKQTRTGLRSQTSLIPPIHY